MTKELKPSEWILDGFNVLKVGGLCRDRENWWDEKSRQILLDELEEFANNDVTVTVVFDGPRAIPHDRDGRKILVRVVFSPSADEWILSEVKSRGAGGQVTVVTADRRLANKALSKGASIYTPSAFLELCRDSKCSP